MARFPTWSHRTSGTRRLPRRKGVTLSLEPLEERTLLDSAPPALAMPGSAGFVQGLYQVQIGRAHV